MARLEPKPSGIGLYYFGKRWLGDGLLISKGKKWARNRRLLTPAFHFDILRPYVTVHNNSVEVLMNKIAEFAENEENMEIFSHVSLCTLDVILRCAFSYENDCQEKGSDHPYVQAVTELGDLWVKRSLEPWVYPNFIYYLTPCGRKFKAKCDFVHRVSKEIIEKRKKTLAHQIDAAVKSHSRYLDFLDILLTAKDEDGKGLTDQEIRDEVDTFLFEGHDTTASSISWTLYSLAEHPDIQQKCREEVDAVLYGRGDDAHIEWEDLPKLVYLTMCIKESMRLHCPVHFIERQLTKEMVIDGNVVPEGAVLDIHIYNLHHNPTVWDRPMEYQPERFLPENMDKKDPFAFIPFSAGPRNCIGQNFAMHEQKVVLARILHRFKFELDTNFKAEKKLGVVMKTANGMRLKFSSRCVFY